MYVERILYPVTVLGPGKRIGVWLQGCIHKCDKCINKELWSQKEQNFIPCDVLYECMKKVYETNQVDGITFTGGDPLLQSEELLELVKKIKQDKLEILVYTGYEQKDIQKMDRGRELLDNIDVLIDGKYIDELNIDNLALRGSSNQNIIIMNNSIKDKYETYILEGRKLENFYMKDYMVSVGIHNRRKDG